LGLQWNFLRTPQETFYSLTERPGWLRLHLRPDRLSEQASPSFIGRRQQHIHFAAQTALEFTSRSAQECAGLALVQSNDFHYCLVVTQTSVNVVVLIKRAHGVEEILAEHPIRAGRIQLKVEAHGQDYNFYAADEPGNWIAVAEAVDGRILSTPVAGGFLGTFIGMYASSNGQPAANNADFDWFEYAGLELA
jgi:alpha-N-arabinofuranosidase